MDYCCVATLVSVKIFQQVPPGTADLLHIGSMEPCTLLLDASDAFDSDRSNADKTARSITQQDGFVATAIVDCLEAAVGKFDARFQKRMLRGASYGLDFGTKMRAKRIRRHVVHHLRL